MEMVCEESRSGSRREEAAEGGGRATYLPVSTHGKRKKGRGKSWCGLCDSFVVGKAWNQTLQRRASTIKWMR